MYVKACALTERLLSNIYDEFKLFCMRVGRPFDPNLSIVKHESTTKGGKYFGEFQAQQAAHVPFHFQMNGQQPMYYPTYYPPAGYAQEFYPQFDGKSYFKPSMNFYTDYANMEITEEAITRLIEARNKARKELNFKEADRIRNYLKAKGIALMDEKGARGKGVEVTTWKYMKGSNFEGELPNFSGSVMTPQKAFG